MRRRRRRRKKKKVQEEGPPPVIPFVVACHQKKNEVDSLISYPDSRYIEIWKREERGNYDLIKRHRDRYHKVKRLSGSFLLDLLTLKDIIFERLSKPVTLDIISDFLVCSSNMYLSLVSLHELFQDWESDLFRAPNDENYDFIAYRLLMRQYLKLEVVIRKYEEDLAISVNQIIKLRPRIRKLDNDNRITQQRIERLKRRNEDLEKQVSVLNSQRASQKKKEEKEKRSLKVTTDAHSKEKTKPRTDKTSRSPPKTSPSSTSEKGGEKDLPSIEIEMMGNRMVQFEKSISSILQDRENRMTDDSQSKLYSMQIQIMHIMKKFKSLSETIKKLNAKIKTMLKKNLDSGKSQKHERKGYNLKIKHARRHLETLKLVLQEFQEGDRILTDDNILSNSDRMHCLDIVIRDQEHIHRTIEVLNEILKPINPKESVSAQLHSLENRYGGSKLRKKYKKEVKKEKYLLARVESEKKKVEGKMYKRRKEMLERKKRRMRKILENNVSMKEHKRVVNDLIQKYKQSEVLYEKKLKKLMHRLARVKKKWKKDKDVKEKETEEKTKMKENLLSPVGDSESSSTVVSKKFSVIKQKKDTSKKSSDTQETNEVTTKVTKTKKKRRKSALPTTTDEQKAEDESEKIIRDPKKKKKYDFMADLDKYTSQEYISSLDDETFKSKRKKVERGLKNVKKVDITKSLDDSALLPRRIKRRRSHSNFFDSKLDEIRKKKLSEKAAKKELKKLEEIFEKHILQKPIKQELRLDLSKVIGSDKRRVMKKSTSMSGIHGKLPPGKKVPNQMKRMKSHMNIKKLDGGESDKQPKNPERSLEQALNQLAGDDELKKNFFLRQRRKMEEMKKTNEKLRKQFKKKNLSKKKLEELEEKIRKEEEKVALEMKEKFMKKRQEEYLRRAKERALRGDREEYVLGGLDGIKKKKNGGGSLFVGGGFSESDSHSQKRRRRRRKTDVLMWIQEKRGQDEERLKRLKKLKKEEKEEEEESFLAQLGSYERNNFGIEDDVDSTNLLSIPLVPRTNTEPDLNNIQEEGTDEEEKEDSQTVRTQQEKAKLVRTNSFSDRKRRPTTPPLKFPGPSQSDEDDHPNVLPKDSTLVGEVEDEGEEKRSDDEEEEVEGEKEYIFITVKTRRKILKYRVPRIRRNTTDKVPSLFIEGDSPEVFFEKKKERMELSVLSTKQKSQKLRNQDDLSQNTRPHRSKDHDFDPDLDDDEEFSDRPRRRIGAGKGDVKSDLEREEELKMKVEFELRKKIHRETGEQIQENQIRNRIQNRLRGNEEEDEDEGSFDLSKLSRIKEAVRSRTPPKGEKINNGDEKITQEIEDERRSIDQSEKQWERMNEENTVEDEIMKKQLEEYEKKMRHIQESKMQLSNQIQNYQIGEKKKKKKRKRKTGEIPISVLLPFTSTFGVVKPSEKKKKRKKSRERRKNNKKRSTSPSKEEDSKNSVVNIDLPEFSTLDQMLVRKNRPRIGYPRTTASTTLSTTSTSSTPSTSRGHSSVFVKGSRKHSDIKEGYDEYTPSKVSIRFPRIQDSEMLSYKFGKLDSPVRMKRLMDDDDEEEEGERIKFYRRDKDGVIKLPSLMTPFKLQKKYYGKKDAELFERVSLIVEQQKKIEEMRERKRGGQPIVRKIILGSEIV